MKDPKAIRKAIMTAKSVAKLIDPHFGRVPLPELGGFGANRPFEEHSPMVHEAYGQPMPEHFGGGGNVGDGDQEIIAYHGSPHEFAAFDMGARGRGHGQSAFGSGHNFAENEDVARRYRDMVARENQIGDVVHKHTGEAIDPNSREAELFRRAVRFGDRDLSHAARAHWPSTIEALRNRIEEFERARPELNDDPWVDSEIADMRHDAAAHERAIALAGTHRFDPKGHMYEVGLKIDPKKMLKWHEPLEMQPEELRRHAATIGDLREGATGADIYRHLSRNQLADPSSVSSLHYSGDRANEILGDLGLHGIQWRDTDSRVAPGHGQNNYTIWDDSRIKVRKRYKDGGYAEGGSPEIDYSQPDNDTGLYSHAANVASQLPQERGSPEQFKNMLLNKGVKPSELEWSEYDHVLGNKPHVTRDEVAKHFWINNPDIKETKFHHGAGSNRLPYHEKYTIPGGENYREILLKRGDGEDGFQGVQGHFGHEPGILASLRMKDREDVQGNKILHLDELQSDWGQQARKHGYKDPERVRLATQKAREANEAFEVANAGDDTDAYLSAREARNQAMREVDSARQAVDPSPYIGKTNDWVDLGLKRALLEAAKGGHDKLAWSPGDVQADRYDLSSHIGEIRHEKNDDGTYNLDVYDPRGGPVLYKEDIPAEKIPEYVGKDMADKIFEGHGDKDEDPGYRDWRSLRGLDLKVGGEGMHHFYDNLLPKRLMRLAKMHDPDAKLSQTLIDHPKEHHDDDWGLSPEQTDTLLPALEITPRMRESILKRGFPAYAEGGEVEGYSYGGGADPAKVKKALERIYNPLSPNLEHVKHALKIAQSYNTPMGGETGVGSFYRIKQSLPVSGVKSTVGNIPGINLKPVKKGSWEDFYNRAKGGLMVNVGGDLSGFGRLTHINGKKLAWPVDLHAGADYMREPNPGRVWANIQAHATSFSKKIRDAEEAGKEVFGVLSPMGPVAVDSSHNMFDALMAQIPGANIDTKDMKAFDDAIKRGEHLEAEDRKNPKIMDALQRWPGIAKAKEASDFARPSSKQISGANRSSIVKFMGQEKWQKMGFPEVGMTRVAITNPDLVGIGGNKLGYRIAKLSSKPVVNAGRVFEHSTYPVDTFGEYLQDVPLVERHDATPDVTDQIITTPYKGDIIAHPYSADDRGRSTYRQLFEQQKQMQPVNQRMLDSIMSADERKQKLGFKKGGTVKRALMIAKGRKKK